MCNWYKFLHICHPGQFWPVFIRRDFKVTREGQIKSCYGECWNSETIDWHVCVFLSLGQWGQRGTVTLSQELPKFPPLLRHLSGFPPRWAPLHLWGVMGESWNTEQVKLCIGIIIYGVHTVGTQGHEVSWHCRSICTCKQACTK